MRQSREAVELVAKTIIAKRPGEEEWWQDSGHYDLRSARAMIGEEVRILDAVDALSYYRHVQTTYAYVLAEVDAGITEHRVVIAVGGNAGRQVMAMAEEGELPVYRVLSTLPAGKHELFYWAETQR